ncbi:MAG: DegT/DnrJ/EryC1/StrS family aminotransferase [Sedimentisphaerales bacterium]|nr:DegT/DnrJ/EryC1/StrS family aminotransferase [Sedimentisphaerales bacterium]
MKINLSSPDITQAEIDAVVAVLSTNQLSLGPKLPQFEADFARYIGRKHAIAVNSGTSALQLILQAAGIGPGDEVITTPFSFISTSNVILMVGATPVFVDIDPDTYNIDSQAIAAKITPKTKAVMPVDVFGNPAGIDTAYDVATQNNLICIEDSCEALGSVVNGRKAGTLGLAGAFAFYPNKQMTTGEGGIILTDDDQIAALCKSLRNQGRDADAGWLAHARLGYNYRLSDINCALGIEQLKRVDSFVAKRSQVAQWYQQALADESRVVVPTEPDNCRMSWFVFVVRLQDQFNAQQRNAVIDILREQGIGCSNYFTPIHLQPFMVEKFGYKLGDFPITENVSQHTIALPFYNNLTQSQVATVAEALTKAIDTATAR